MNKIKVLFLTAILLTVCAVPYATANETVVTPNKLIVFKISESKYYTQDIGSTDVNAVQMDTAPFIQNSRTFVPVRFLGNALGVSDSNISWDNNARKATLQGKSKLELTIGSKTMQKDDNSSVMDVAPIITNSRTMLPARYVAEGLGFKVEWDAVNQLVVAYPEGQQKPDMTAILKKINPLEQEVQKGTQGSKYNQLSAEKVAELKALPYLSTPRMTMGESGVYTALDCPDTYKGLLDKMVLNPGQSFYSSKELMYINWGGRHVVRGVLQTNVNGNVTEREVEARAFYGGSSMQKEWGWHPVYFSDPRTAEAVQ